MLFTIDDYKNALLFGDSFKTLSRLKPVKDKNDDFLFSSGSFSVVFKMQDMNSGKYHALKCFCHINPEHLEHSKEVADYLYYIKSPYLASYKFYEDEIWLDNNMEEPAYFPVILMDWMEGETLGKYLEMRCQTGNTEPILSLALAFDQMAIWLLQQDFAHGDLKNDNILIQRNGLPVLVDYDGCFVPGMEDKKAPEVGTPAFQHPKRDEWYFNKDLDDVSILVISLSLHALATDTDLWKECHNGENLILAEQDLLHPQTSGLWSKLYEYENPALNNRLSLLQYGLNVFQSIPGINLALKPQKEHLYFYQENKLKNDSFPVLIPYRKGDKWGFCDRNRSIIIPCVYESVGKFSEGMAEVYKNGKGGFVHITGTEVIPCVYNIVDKFSEGLAKVKKKGKFGYINLRGIEIIPCIYDGINSFKDGLASIMKKNVFGSVDKFGKEVVPCIYELKNFQLSLFSIPSIQYYDRLARVAYHGKWGYINKEANVIIPFIYEDASIFSEGLARVKRKGLWGFVDKLGNEIVPFFYIDAFNFSNGLAKVKKNRLWGFVDKTGNEIIPFLYIDAFNFSNGLAKVNRNGLWGFVDEKGNEVISCTYFNASSFNEGLIWVKKLYKWGLIDKKGEEVTPFIYDDIDEYDEQYDDDDNEYFFSDGLANIRKNGKWGFVNTEGVEIIRFRYDDANPFSKGLATVKKNKWGIIDKQGNEVVPFIYDEIYLNDDGFELKENLFDKLVPVQKNGKWGIINRQRKEVIQCFYDEPFYFKNGLVGIKKNGKYGFINQYGKEIIQCQYISVEPFLHGLSRVKKNEKYGYIDQQGNEYWEDHDKIDVDIFEENEVDLPF